MTLVLAGVAAIVFVAAGVVYLRGGSGSGWVLIGVGVLPLVFAIWIRFWIHGSGPSD